MNQSNWLTRKLTAAQDKVFNVKPAQAEVSPKGNTESSGVIEIIATRDDLQKVVFLAGDIKAVNAQASVLVTYAAVVAVSV